MTRKLRQYLQRLRNLFIFDTGDYRQTVLLAGAGRSGTTWVEEVINSDNDYRMMFEPFHSKYVDLLTEWNYVQYLRVNENNEKFLKPATSILTGNIRNDWIDKFNKRIFSQKRLIKDIRAQFILKWIKHNFPEIPIILLLRHPCAVANSRLKLGWNTHLEDILVQDDLMEDFLNPFKEKLENAKDKDLFDRHIYMWCIQNYIPLKQFNEGEVLVIFYEDICINPETEIERIFSFIGEEISSKTIDKVKKPSALSQKDSAVVSGTDLVGSWRKNISNDQIERAFEILSIFGLQKIYDKSNFPLVSGPEALKIFPI